MNHNINWETGYCCQCGKKLKSIDALKECKANTCWCSIGREWNSMLKHDKSCKNKKVPSYLKVEDNRKSTI